MRILWAVTTGVGGVGVGGNKGGGGAGNALPAAPTTHTHPHYPKKLHPPTVVVMGGEDPHRR